MRIIIGGREWPVARPDNTEIYAHASEEMQELINADIAATAEWDRRYNDWDSIIDELRTRVDSDMDLGTLTYFAAAAFAALSLAEACRLVARFQAADDAATEAAETQDFAEAAFLAAPLRSHADLAAYIAHGKIVTAREGNAVLGAKMARHMAASRESLSTPVRDITP